MRFVPVALFALLAACTAAPRPVSLPQVSAPLRPTGLQAVLGQPAEALVASFGTPALDLRDGAGRKLQFRSGICVLDAYLYPPAGGGTAIVTYIDARQPDGRDLDRASCVAALKAARQ